jgi:hypothetical protein
VTIIVSTNAANYTIPLKRFGGLDLKNIRNIMFVVWGANRGGSFNTYIKPNIVIPPTIPVTPKDALLNALKQDSAVKKALEISLKDQADKILDMLWEAGAGNITKDEADVRLIGLMPTSDKGLRDQLLLFTSSVMLSMGMRKYRSEEPSDLDINSIAATLKDKDIEILMPDSLLSNDLKGAVRNAIDKKFGGKVRSYKSIDKIEDMLEGKDLSKIIIMTVGLSENDIDRISAFKKDLKAARFMNFEDMDVKSMSPEEYENYIAETLSILLIGRAITPEEANDKGSTMYRMLAHLLEDHIPNIEK